MSRTVLILGIDHGFQRRDPQFDDAQQEQFTIFVTDIVNANGVVALAEEYSAEALVSDKITETTVQTIARKLGVNHRHCDPDRKTREALNIRQENDIRASFMFEDVNEAAIQQCVEESMRSRERYWLAQLLEFNMWPVLFICGPNHSLPFLNLLRGNAIDSILVAQDWGT
jgi:hypothetical protein